MATQPTNAELLEALKGLVRYVDAVRHSAGMGKNQVDRLNAAKDLIARSEQAHASALEALNTENNEMVALSKGGLA